MTEISLYILGDVIKHVERHEYLGIIIDDKLSFKYHSIKCSSRASNKMYQLREIRGCITTKCALTIYKTMVLPLFEYGGLFLDSCTATEQTKMQRLQKPGTENNLYYINKIIMLMYTISITQQTFYP